MNKAKTVLLVAFFFLVIMILLVVFISANNVSARTINVNAAGGGDYTTIQAAINAASAGDTVYVYNGTYNEQITTSKSIDIVGQSNQSTIIRGTGASNTKGVSITTNFVNISNMRVDNFDYGIILTSSSTNILTNTNITNSGTYDIQLKASSLKSINSTFVPTVETLTTLSAKLPSGRYWASAIWDGTNVYIFGGCDSNNYFDQIVKFNPSTGTVTTLAAKLPSARAYTSAIWDGANAYIFGGFDYDGNILDKIVKFNPSTGVVTTLNAHLPNRMCYTSAIWDGTNTYIFGGFDGNGNTVDKIIKFNPNTGGQQVTILNAKLPSERRSTSAIWDGTNAYIFGGSDDNNNILDQIVKFNPAGTVTTLTTKLPTGRYGTSAIWDGTNAYVFAGVDSSNTKVDIITRFNPTTSTVTTLTTKFSSGRIHTLSVWDGTNAYILGGFLSATEASDQIVKFTPGKIYCDATSKLEIANYLQVSVAHASNSSMKWARIEVKDNDRIIFNDYTDTNGTIDWLLATKKTYTSGAVTENRTTINVYCPGYSFNNNNRAVDMGMAHVEYFAANESSACYIGDNFTEDFDNSYYMESSNKINVSGGKAQVSPQSQQTTGRAAGLVAYWGFDEGTGTTASDSSGNGNTGTIYGGAAWVDGISGKALQFDGGGDYVAVPGSASLSTVGAITVELWMKTSIGDTNFIIQKYDNVGTNPYGYALHFAIAGHPDKLEFWDGVSWSRVTTTHITDDAWHHVVVTGNGSAGVFYIDGIAGPSFTFHTVSDSPSEVLYIGAFEGIGSFFSGLIDEVRIYNRALSAAEVYDAYVNTINSNFMTSPIFPYNITSYDDLTCNASINTAQNQSITVSVLDADTNQILLTSNITDGISETRLSTISPLAHPAIKFNFAFASAGTSSPSLYSYSISWLRHSKPEVNVTFTGLVDDSTMVVEAYNAFNAIVSAHSLNGISLYEWDIDGDGAYEHSNTTTGNKTINFTTTGSKTISLRVTDSSGVQAVESYTFTVVPNLGPQINAVFYNLHTLTNITITDLTIPQGRNFAVNISAQDKDGIGSIKIDPYGDGNQVATSINKTYCNATWHYDNTGNYTLKVNATDGVGMESEKTYIIHVIANLLPTANFTIPANWSANSPLQLFSNSSDADGSIAYYTWNFGDGNNSYESSPEHTWSSKGNFDITLTIIDDLGGMDSIKRTLLIVNAAPLVTLSANTTTAHTYETIKFYETSVTDTDGYVVLHSYDFGDGTLVNITDSGITSIEHNYTAKGTYNVTLRVYDNDGGYAVKKIAVTIINTPPTFVYVPTDLSALSLTSLKFNATVQDIDGTVVNYTWNFGDNNLDNLAYAQTSLHSYSMPGNYTATLTITDNDGGTAVKSMSVTITNRPPSCSFTASSDKKPAEELALTANATDSDGVVVKYKWDFGDKNSTEWVDNGVIKHTYMRAGKYNASLIVMDNNGAESAVAYDTVTVVNIPPIAIIVRPKYVYIDEETQFLGNGSKDTYGSIVSYRWDFDDGTTSTEINPKHTYKKIGTYKISLTVTDDSGDTDKENETIEIIAQAQIPPGGGNNDIMGYLDVYANLIGLLIALASVAGGYIVLRRKRSTLGRQMTLVENAVKMHNPIERYRRLCDIQKASSKLLQRGKISESNYMILDNKIRDYKNVLEKKHPDIEKVAELQKSPYQQSEKDELKLDSHGEYKNE